MMGFLRDAKFTLAFSNLVATTAYTHPKREYITGRWTDALAAGAAVAGIPPRSESVHSLLWPDALLDLETASRTEGLEVIAAAVREWTPSRARVNYLRSLERLDWRLKQIAGALGVQARSLDAELVRLSQIIDSDLPAIPNV